LLEQKTYKEIVQLWRHFPLDSSGHISDDIGMSDMAILNHLLDTRSEILSEIHSSGQQLGPQNFQTLSCVELESVTKTHEMPCIPPSGCIWLRSSKPIPRFIKISSVSDIEGHENISFVEWTKAKIKFNSRHKGNRDKKYYTIRDSGEGSYIYILNDDFLKVVSVSAVFEDPRLAREFPGCERDLTKIICNPWDTPFKVDAGLRNKILKSAWQILPALRGSTISDTDNNSLDDTVKYRRNDSI
jgi:hypothetical protein